MPSQEPSSPIRALFQDRSAALHPALRKPGDIEPNWPYFVSLHSKEGFHWAEEYGCHEHVRLIEATTQSLNLLRRRKIGLGLELLRDVEVSLAKLERTSPVFFHVLGRWYFGALAYYYYCTEDFARAFQTLDKANNAVVLDKTIADKLNKDVQSYRLVTVAVLVDRLKINGSLARKALKDLEEKGVITKVVGHNAGSIYTRTGAAGTAE